MGRTGLARWLHSLRPFTEKLRKAKDPWEHSRSPTVIPNQINKYKSIAEGDLNAQTKRNDTAILLNLPESVLAQVDVAVREQGVSRSHFLRQAVERNLNHYQRCERALFAQMHRQGMS